jgi:hypothetical protein
LKYSGVGYLFGAAITAIIAACFSAAYPGVMWPDDYNWVDSRTNILQYTDIIQEQQYFNAIAGSCPPQADYAW